MKSSLAKSAEISRKVCLYGDRAIEINGKRKTPDLTRAYVECYLSHAFPVVTLFGTAIHPQVVANSFSSMEDKLLDLHHMVVAYDPENTPRDRALGTVVGVEFPSTPEGGWKVQADKAKAPGIRAVSVLHRQLEQVEEIIQFQQSGKMRWTVSMEHKFFMETSGYLVRGRNGLEAAYKKTPEDLRAVGCTYISYQDAPAELRACFDEDGIKVIGDFMGQNVVFLLGGLNNTIHYMGIGLTPIGKEKEAYISQMLASGIDYVDLDGELLPKFMAPLHQTLGLLKLK